MEEGREEGSSHLDCEPGVLLIEQLHRGVRGSQDLDSSLCCSAHWQFH